MEFRPSPKRLIGPAFFVLAFLAWATAAAIALRVAPGRQMSPLAYLIPVGVPFAMLLLSCGYLVSCFCVIVVERDRLLFRNPFGTREVRWTDVEGYDLEGTAKRGLKLRIRDAKPLSIDFTPFENSDMLRDQLYAHIPKRDPARTGPITIRSSGRVALPILLFGVLGLFAAVFLTNPSIKGDKGPFLLMIGLCAVLFGVLSMYSLTYRSTLDGRIFTTTSCFGTAVFDLANVRSVDLSIFSGKGGPRETLALTGPTGKKAYLAASMSNYVAIRDAILAVAPPERVKDRRSR